MDTKYANMQLRQSMRFFSIAMLRIQMLQKQCRLLDMGVISRSY